jgi:hypothetical protein
MPASAVVAVPGGEQLRGRLVDDLGNGIAGVDLEISGDEPEMDPLTCAGFPVVRSKNSATWILRTDDDGAFCMQASVVPPEASYRLRFEGTRLFAPLDAEFRPQRGRHALRLEITPQALEAVLDLPEWVAWVSAAPLGDGLDGDLLALEVSYADTAESASTRQLGILQVPIGGRARLEIPTRDLGPPGLGDLVLYGPGTATLAPIELRRPLRRVAAVELSLTSAPEAVEAGSKFSLIVGAGYALGPVPGGWVQVSSYGRLLAHGPVREGAARIDLVLDSPSGEGSHPIVLEYVAGEPFWLPGDPLVVEIPMKPASPLSALPWILTVVALAFSIFRTWRRPPRRRSVRREEPAPPAREGVTLVQGGDPSSGWSGQVIDAHDGTPLAGASLRVVIPVFDGEGIAVSTTASDDGDFTIPPNHALPPASQLLVRSPHHATLSRRMPPPGRLIVAMTSRRRALLDRFVAWAKRSGPTVSSTLDPTPGDVLLAARRRGEPEVQHWVQGIEEAAFGPVDPDEALEQALGAREPRPPKASHKER